MRNVVLIAAVLIHAFSVCSPALAEENTTELRHAQKLYDDGKYQEAALALEEICKRQPTLADAHRLLGHAYYKLGRTDDARRALAQAVAHGRLTTDVLARLVQIDRQQNRNASLLAGLRLLMLIDSEDRAWDILYADDLESSGASAEAEHVYRRIIEDDPARGDVFVRLGNLYLRQHRNQEAAVAFVTACHLGESSPGLPKTIAELWFNAGDRRQALLWYERTLKLHDAPPESLLLRRAELLLWAEEFDRAEAAALPLAESSNRGLASKALLLLGQVAMQRNRPEEAVAHWEQAVQAGIAEPGILEFLGSHCFNSGQYGKAAGHLERRLTTGGPDKTLLRYLTISLIRSGEHERAKAAIETYLEHYGLDESAEQLISAATRQGGEVACSPARQ